MINRAKRLFAASSSRIGVNRILLHLFTQCCFPYIRAVNYHATPKDSGDSLARHLAFYRERFSNVSSATLDRFFQEKALSTRKPGLIISFDDGLRDNYEVAAPLLEEYGFTGWFFVPTDFISTPAGKQIDFAVQHSITFGDAADDKRLAMTWDEVKLLSRNHVVGCHTATHRRMYASTSADDLDHDIAQSKRELERQLAKKVDHFCWVGGEEESYSHAAAKVVHAASFRYAFMTNSAPIRPWTDPLQMQRTNIEASWPLDVVEFQISGIMDLIYRGKRRRVNRLTATAQ